MRFFTTLEPAGRLEFFLVRFVLTIALFALTFFVLDLRLVDTTLTDNPSATDRFSYSQQFLPMFLVGYVVVLFFLIINACRRLKDIGFSLGLAALLFVPIISIVFELFLLLSRGMSKQTYAPYGDNPYDPQSWVAPPNPNGGPAVTYQGQDLYLPGEMAAPPQQNPGEQAA